MFNNALMKLRLHIAKGAGLVVAVSVLAPASAGAADWTPRLIVPPGGIYGPTDPIRLRLPELPDEVLQSLALELDDFDVTSLVARDGDIATYTPPQALTYGEHQLRLVENAPDGSIIERGVWTVSVRKSAAFREASLQAATTLNGVRRIADDDLPQPEPKRNQWNGGAQVQGALADADWRFAGQADLITNSQRALLPRGEEGGRLDLANFLLGYDHGPVVARAGHHSVGPESLIMADFLRRGVSVGLQSAQAGAAATAFSLRTDDIVGFQKGLGVSDAENRTDGVTLAFQPAGGGSDALLISATYLNGKGRSQSSAATGAAVEEPATSGKAASIVADSNLLERRLRLRGEYAATRFDFDGAGTDTDLDGAIDSDLAPERDDAYSAFVQYLPWHEKLVNGQPLAWRLGVENKRLGTFFRSPANPIATPDRKLLRGFTGVTWSGFDAQLSVGRESDNVNDLPLIARTETAQNMLSLTYTPQAQLDAAAGDGLPPTRWYGQPVFNVTYVDLDQDVVKAGSGLGIGNFNTVQTVALTANFSYPTWDWTVGHTIGKSEDFMGLAPDTDTTATQLGANLRVGKRLTLGPVWQWSETDEFDVPFGVAPRRLEMLTAGLSLGYLFSDQLSSAVGYNVNRVEASDASQDATTRDVIVNIAWTVVPPREMRPGFTLSLDGQYHDFDDRVFVASTVSQYQLFLTASVSWLPTW